MQPLSVSITDQGDGRGTGQGVTGATYLPEA